MVNGSSYHKSRAVIDALIQGTDPETGAELPANSIANRIQVNRALLVAVSAMEQVHARNLRRALLPEKVGRTWSDDEERQLREEFANSEPIPLIAEKHRRTIRAIEARLERMALLRADQRTTSDSFLGPPVKKEPQRD